MSLFVNFLCGGEKVRKTACDQEIDKLTEIEELLVKKKEFLRKKIDQELLTAKKNSIKNRRVALQALRRKKWCEKHLKHIDCAFRAMRSAHEHIETFNKVTDLIKDIPKEEDVTSDMSDDLFSSVNQEVEFDEDELLAELERLEKSLDQSFFEVDGTDDRVHFSTVSPSHPAKTEEEEVEDDLEYLLRWANESL
ncbi:charged multivesicular body protein 4b-like [Odontesthes bonariensis]|uniref:charged multivesicular body protein 4b-like n=1 Tax=Odontesthes bonariensis TaxID=219752 RepID=UPI003F58D021